MTSLTRFRAWIANASIFCSRSVPFPVSRSTFVVPEGLATASATYPLYHNVRDSQRSNRFYSRCPVWCITARWSGSSTLHCSSAASSFEAHYFMISLRTSCFRFPMQQTCAYWPQIHNRWTPVSIAHSLPDQLQYLVWVPDSCLCFPVSSPQIALLTGVYTAKEDQDWLANNWTCWRIMWAIVWISDTA